MKRRYDNGTWSRRRRKIENSPRNSWGFEATCNAQGKPEDSGDGQRDEDELAPADAQQDPETGCVGDQAESDTGDEKKDTVGRRHAHDLQEVAGVGEQGNAEQLAQDVGERDDPGAATVRVAEAVAVRRGVHVGLAHFHLDRDAQLLDRRLAVARRDIEPGLALERVLQPALADQPRRALRDDDAHDQRDGGEGPLRDEADVVRLLARRVQRGEDDDRADQLAQQREDGEQRHDRSAQRRGDDLGHPGLDRADEAADGEALDQLPREEEPASAVDVVRLVRHEADGHGDGGEDAGRGERDPAAEAVLQPAGGDGTNGQAQGAGGVPEREPFRGDDVFVVVVAAEFSPLRKVSAFV